MLTMLNHSIQRSQVFISYSHVDAEFLGRLKVHMRPFERQGHVDLWADSRITPGDRWKQEISVAMDRATIAIILVSADFLASDFIAENELPPLLEAAQSNGVRILPVILKPCAFNEMPELSQFQSVNDPRKPLASLSENDREQIWYNLAIAVHDQLTKTAVFNEESKSDTDGYETPKVSLHLGLSLYAEEFDNPDIINDFFVYEYQHIDEFAFMPLATDMLSHHPRFDKVLEKVKYRLKSEGWAGDGQVRLLWFPPFIGAGVEDTWGVGTWFVKQRNNGTAWIASPVPLPFARLLEQQDT